MPKYDTHIPLMEHFATLQGEGQYGGCAAYFLRLALCDVGCVWCDVKESWTLTDDQWKPLDFIESQLEGFKGDIVVVTGGEPTLHPLQKLTDTIHNLGKRTHMETAGTNVISGSWDWITLSPKKFKPCLEENYPKANELKVVIFHRSDLLWAKEMAEKCSATCKLYIQPEWSKRDAILPEILEFIQDNPKWALSLQSHKYINIP
jgi:organic radical activating enzyme